MDKTTENTEQRTVLITGALGVTGRLLCKRFKQLGYFVVATDQKQGVCDCHFFVHVDLTRLLLREPPEMFRQVVERAMGGRPLHLVILNAAIDDDRDFDAVSVESMRNTFNCNVLAPTVLLQQLRPQLAASRGVAIFTTSAYRKNHLNGKVEYAASKYALKGLVSALGEEMGDTIRVYGVGAAETSLHDKMDRPDEFGERIADASVRAVRDESFISSGNVVYI